MLTQAPELCCRRRLAGGVKELLTLDEAAEFQPPRPAFNSKRMEANGEPVSSAARRKALSRSLTAIAVHVPFVASDSETALQYTEAPRVAIHVATCSAFAQHDVVVDLLKPF
ncbi:unnamed protein product [Phytophthora fragariaefolia]|uniref:Unnamed protein product n=1 Tax=Phytophthora fragariaefolia TaxID=1490495 RepID=A0A9W6WWV7_9STRA|nr:unnamed protein product [Phytophthora fragariaefolia]